MVIALIYQHTHTWFLALVFFFCPSWGFSHGCFMYNTGYKQNLVCSSHINILQNDPTFWSPFWLSLQSLVTFSYIIFFMTSGKLIALHFEVSALDFSLSMYVVLPYWISSGWFLNHLKLLMPLWIFIFIFKWTFSYT